MGIVNTYTPQGGYTPAAQGVQNLTDTLASITGSPAGGAYAAAAQAGPNYSANPNIAMLSDEEEKLKTLFANDQALAAKYVNPNLYGGGATAPSGNPAGVFASPLQATDESITSSGGAITPDALIGMIGGNIKGQEGMLSKVMNAMDFNKQRSLEAYKAMLGALETIYTQGEETKRKEKEIAAASGTKLTSAEKAVVNSTKTALDLLRQIKNLGTLKTGIVQGSITKLTKSKAGTSAYNKELSDLDSKLGPLKLAVMNAMIGTQMSKPEIAMVEAWIPSITQDPELFKQNITNLENFLQSRLDAYSGEDVTDTSTTEVTTPTTSQTTGTWI